MPEASGQDGPVLEIEGLRVAFDTLEGTVEVLRGVDLTVHRGQAVGLVGESGSGKSVTAVSVLRLLAEPPARLTGAIRFYPETESASGPGTTAGLGVPSESTKAAGHDSTAAGPSTAPGPGEVPETDADPGTGAPVPTSGMPPGPGAPPVDLARLDPGSKAMQAIRGNDIAMVFQEPMSSLSPVFTVGHQVAEVIWLHRDRTRRQAHAEAQEMLAQVGIPEPARVARLYPHNLSGGQLQRVMIAMALACRPALLIADEPTTALDVTIQAQIMGLLQSLRETLNLAVLLITHDLAVVAGFCDRVNVMYMGRVVEEGSVQAIFRRPAHPYTQGLLRSIPVPGQQHKERFPAIPGTVPEPRQVPPGCAFGPRCDRFEAGRCDQEAATARVPVGVDHAARCWRIEATGPAAAGTPSATPPTEGGR